MTRTSTWLSGVALVGAATVLGIGALTSSSSTQITTARLGPLPGRHLQVPWWETTSVVHGAGEVVKLTIPGAVLFETGSSRVSAFGRHTLRTLVPTLLRVGRLDIEGCTDAVGGESSLANIALSWRRAEAVRAELVELGVSPTSMVLSALADTEPVPGTRGLDQATVNALNRRVIIIATSKDRPT